jgi:3,4-dihydroxy 2-butanone 4-phosphate synthase/GTP cyclohydrolase II
VPAEDGRDDVTLLAETLRFSTIEDALADIATGRMVVVLDDHDDESEGNVVMAAEHVTPESVNFMTRQAGGWICLALTPARCEELDLRLMAARDEDEHRAPFTTTIEARTGVTTGISVHDQARTMRIAADPACGADDIVQPGHVHPLKARAGGVLERTGRAEAAVDLARLAGGVPAGITCEIQNLDGTMARARDLVDYCRQHGLRAVTIADLIAYRRRHDRLVERVVTTALPTRFGRFEAVGYRSLLSGDQHMAIVKGDVVGAPGVLVRVHAGCPAGDVFQSRLCGCGQRLADALAAIEAEGRGVLLYLTAGADALGDATAIHAARSPTTELRDLGIVVRSRSISIVHARGRLGSAGARPRRVRTPADPWLCGGCS